MRRYAALLALLLDGHPGVVVQALQFVAQVETADARADLGKEPLLYFRGKYSRLHP